MLFDIFEYNISLALFIYFLSLFLLFVIFKKQIITLADPLLFHLLWLSSQIAFFVIYAEHNLITSVYIIFVISLITYLSSLIFFTRYYAKLYKKEKQTNIGNLNSSNVITIKRWRLIIIILVLLFLYSNSSFIQFALTAGNPAELFLYRFTELQGRVPSERILKISSYFLIFYIFLGLHIGIHRKLSISLIVLILIFDLAAGGRSALITMLGSAGAYIFIFKSKINKSFIKKFNVISIFLLIFSIIIAMLVSSFYETDATFQTGALVIFNRIFAAPDGIEYYLNNSGESKIQSGLFPYFMSIFGIYVKGLLDIDYKNIGWQLTELVVGEVSFAQGANYTFLLQSVVFSIFLAPIYSAFVAWAISILRYVKFSSFKSAPLAFVSCLICFNIATDIEFFFFLLLSTLIVYYLVIYPLANFKL